ncbi:MAG: nitrogen regulation protein NR(II) [Kangiellaceae bacterium]|nr:nitrogen regulation protein NR(II) [Kangiellaceae bacterium]MCW9015420.1 nitrogen regulation protein NR(II) [Kangiellaceae bacterium]
MIDFLTFNSLSTAIILLDSNYQVNYLNQSAEQLLGFSARHIKQESFFNLVHADFEPKTFTHLASQQQSCFIEETQLKTATGIITTNIMVSGFRHNDIQHILLELQTSEHHSHIRKDMELQHQSRVSTHLIRNLAHEIKNPLGGIKGAAQLLERKLPQTVSNQYTQVIIQESDRLSGLVDRMLLPAEPEKPQQVNIHQIIEKALEIVLLQQVHNFKVIKDYDPSLPDLKLCPGQIQQALLNLLKNAVEALQEDGQIRLRTRILLQHTIGKVQHRQVIRIDVIDNGMGVPDNIIKDIFFPTISGKNSSGLGLSIAQSLVQRHGGIIEVESQPAKTCFSIYLPLEFIYE